MPPQLKQDAVNAERQYTKLLTTLSRAGLIAVGRRGETQGQLVVLITCSNALLKRLIHRERHSDFLYGLPMSNSTSTAAQFDSGSLSPADRIRLVHGFLTSTAQDGGLGIIPECSEWRYVQSILCLHDHNFNESWIRQWTTHRIASVQLDNIRFQFGDSIALYFFFLQAYTRALIFPAALGILFYAFGTPYSALYSSLIMIWSIVFVEWWRLQERILSVRWCTRGSFRVEKRRADYISGFPWWKREFRMIASIPVILLFATVLASVLTAIFILEAFVTHLYKGPGHKYISFSPTVLFMALVPRLLSIYQHYAKRFTEWENHAHQSSHEASLAVKIFALSSINSYLGLALSAFVYVPFGESVMRFVQYNVFDGGNRATAILQSLNLNFTELAKSGGSNEGKYSAGRIHGLWETDRTSARRKLNPSRLQEQMFAFTVTNQAVDTFTEIGLPFILRAYDAFRSGKGLMNGSMKTNGKKKRVAFQDEDAGRDDKGREEREFLEIVRSEASLPDYELYGDYSEMVSQFGYVALWSTIWPLAPVMALLNNILEARSDAFKIAVHTRRPIPVRTDTIGAWLELLSFISWLSALTNSALVYLFRPPDNAEHGLGTVLDTESTRVHRDIYDHHQPNAIAATRELLISALLVSLVASHGYLLIKVLIRHVLERALWRGSKERLEEEKTEKEVKERYLSHLDNELREDKTVVNEVGSKTEADEQDKWESFWAADEGLDEIRKTIKDV